MGLTPAVVAAQRPLHGVVADQATMSLIDSARVTVVGTELEAVTAGDGTFSFEGVPLGSLAVRIEAPGYPVVVEQVEVVRDVILYMQVMMPRADIILGELVTPPGAVSDARTAAELVARKVLDMNPNSGNLGLNTNPVRLRGTGTFGLAGEPAVFLDGVRIGTFGPAMEVLSQIPARDVRNIRVLRGPASGFLQGSADGSIHIETRSGPGRPRTSRRRGTQPPKTLPFDTRNPAPYQSEGRSASTIATRGLPEETRCRSRRDR